MSRNFYLYLSILITFIFINTSVLSQPANLNHTGYKSQEQVRIEKEIAELKKEDISSNVSRIAELNSKLEKLNGLNKTILTCYSGGEFRVAPETVPPENNSDYIPNTMIFSNPGTIRGIAACIEQRGSTAGKIWLIVVYSAGNTSPDTLKIFYSANNALTWNLYGTGNIRPLDKINQNDLDMELIENTTGQKYLWIAYGYKQNGGAGPWMTGGFVLQVPAIAATFFNALNWPGEDSTKRYYNIHLTSDNARYAATSYLFMICSFDSVNSGGIRVNSQKFARCLNPYTASSPAFSYMGQQLYHSDSQGPAGLERTVYSDICYFYNGDADSVEVSYCGGADSTNLYFAKSDINGNPPSGSTGAGELIGGAQPNDIKTFASLSSNGNNNGSVVCVFRQFTGGSWFDKWFLTDNYGNFNSINSESTLWGSNVNTNYQADVASVRNGNTHYIAFTTKAAQDSVHYISLNSSGAVTYSPVMNYYSASGGQSPIALFRYQNNDSCLVLYSEDGSLNLISAAGCTGDPIGIISNSSIAKEFLLKQNYPNPFNPSTKIKFEIAKTLFTTLTVYDALGRKIETLINQNLNQGQYETQWDGSKYSSGIYFYKLTAGVFSEIKKMVLIK